MMKFERFPLILFEFLKQLPDNNNDNTRLWFHGNKLRYGAMCWNPRWPFSPEPISCCAVRRDP